MKKIKRILIATDLSPLSFSALEKGLEIAQNYNAQVTILHILEKGFFDDLRKNVLTPVRKLLINPREYAEQLIRKEINKSLRKKLKIDIEILTTKLKPSKKIINYSKKIKADLMLLGAHGRYKFHDWFVGTTAEYIVKKTQCPLLITKNTKKSFYKRILLPVDFSMASKEAVVFGRDLFPNSNFYVLNVADAAYDELIKKHHFKEQQPRKEIMQLLLNKTKQFIANTINSKTKFSFKVKTGYAGLAILEEAQQIKPNLVIMGTQGHNQHYYKWLGSAANRVLIEIDKDILLVPPTKKPKTPKKGIDQKDVFLKRMTALTEEHFQQLKDLAKT